MYCVVDIQENHLYILEKRIGPRTVPWGTPDVTGALLDISPSSTTVWVRSVRKSEIQSYRIYRNISVHRVGVGGALYQRPLQNP